MKLFSDEKVRGGLEWFTYLLLFLLAALPIAEILLRLFFKTGISGASDYMRHIVLWVTFLGGVITTRDGRHLAFTAILDKLQPRTKEIVRSLTSFFTVMVPTILLLSSLSFALIGFESSQKIGFLPLQFILLIMPVCYLAILMVFIAQGSKISKWGIVPAILGLLVGVVAGNGPLIEMLRLVFTSEQSGLLLDSMTTLLAVPMQAIALPVILLLITFALFGAPIFVVLAGLALFLFTRSAGTLAVVPNEAYTILTSPAIIAIPLFSLAGFLLAGGKSGERLVVLFKAMLGWLPGGMAIVAILLCAFFTTFTGASGITILALGGLLSYVLINNGYSRGFALGLLTASGSIGLLFPPSLPLIMYGVMAQINIKHIFIAGLLPGILMIITFALLGLNHAIKAKVPRTPFDLKHALVSLKDAAWEILLPVVILVGYFSGIFTLVETSAVAALYSLLVVTVFHKDIGFKEMGAVMHKCLVLIGGVLIILSAAKGLSYFIVDTELPSRLVEWTQRVIHSKIAFLVVLNLALLVTGCLMDIFSAIIVVVPLILPLGRAFGIDPIHLGIIFLANMELGYLTPSVGLNLFISSYTFSEPIGRLYRYAFPFIVLIFINVILITYLPWLTTVLIPK